MKGELENVSIVGTIDLLRLLQRAIQHLCVFNNISDLRQKSYLQRSFTFSSIALPLLCKDFRNKDNNLFIDDFQLQSLNSSESSFINAVCQ